MPNLNELPEEDLTAYKTQMLEAIKNSMQLQKEEVTTTQNGNKYIHIITQVKNENNVLDMSVYYTIMNGRLITISFRYYNQSDQIVNDMEQQTLQGIQFYEIERPNVTLNKTTYLAMGITAAMMLVIGIIVIIIRIKDKRLIDNNIKDRQTKTYSKFGGLTFFFWALCFYQVLLRVIDIDNATKIPNMEFYTTNVIIQSTILALIAMYQIYITLKRKQNTPKKIIITNLIFMISGIIMTVARIIYALIVPMEIYTQQYFKEEISILLFNIIYPLIWILYFKFSKRVQIYYYLPERRKKVKNGKKEKSDT